MKRRLPEIALACAWVALIIYLLTGAAITHHAHAPRQAPHATVVTSNAPSRITEDDPRWNCHTMGNHRCGHRR